MTKRFRPLFRVLVCLAAALTAMYLGRVLGLFLLSRAFSALNLNSNTYNAAPAWMRSLADNADALSNLTALLLGACALLFLRGLFTDGPDRFKARYALAFILPAILGYGSVRLLRMLDELRLDAGANYALASAAQAALWALFALVQALFLRGCLCEGVYQSLGKKAALALSAVLQAAVYVLTGTGMGILPVVNGLLAGALFWFMYESSRSLWPEALLFFGFALGSRVLGGYPDGPVYAVSRSVWTGFGAGLEASLFLTIILAALCAYCARGRIRSFLHVSKAAVSRKSLRGQKEGR